MPRKPAIKEEEFLAIKETTIDIPKAEKETVDCYVTRINKYSGQRAISRKTITRILGANTYDEYLEIVKKDSSNKPKKPIHVEAEEVPEHEDPPEEEHDEDINAMLRQILNRLTNIERRLDMAEVRICAYPDEDKLTDWKTLRDEIKKNNTKEAV